jgi:hypothetical protein
MFRGGAMCQGDAMVRVRRRFCAEFIHHCGGLHALVSVNKK